MTHTAEKFYWIFKLFSIKLFNLIKSSLKIQSNFSAVWVITGPQKTTCVFFDGPFNFLQRDFEKYRIIFFCESGLKGFIVALSKYKDVWLSVSAFFHALKSDQNFLNIDVYDLKNYHSIFYAKIRLYISNFANELRVILCMEKYIINAYIVLHMLCGMYDALTNIHLLVYALT